MFCGMLRRRLMATFCICLCSGFAAEAQTINADINTVIAAGKVNANEYRNDYFGLTLTAPNGEIQAPVFVNQEAQRARLAEAYSKIKVGPLKYSVGLLVDSRAKNGRIFTPERYIIAVRHQLEKEDSTTVREEFPIDVSGVTFVGTVLKVKFGSQFYYRGLYATFLNGYILSFDVKADTPERLPELLASGVRFKKSQ